MTPIDAYSETLTELIQHKDIIIIATDDIKKTKLNEFQKQHPNRIIQCGKTQHALSVAIGAAKEGKTVFVSACITPGANWDDIRRIAQNKENIKIIDTHEQPADTTLASALPELTIIIPADYEEAKKAIIAAATTKGPVYLKLENHNKTITNKKTPFTIGRAEIMRAGKDCTIIACGENAHTALEAAEKLSQQEINCTVLNNHTLQPLDKHALLASTRITRCAVITEQLLGEKTANLLSQHNPSPIRTLTKPQTSDIVKAAREVILQSCAETCAETHEQHGKTPRFEISPELHFRLKNGGAIKNIPALQKALLEIEKETFTHHCNEHKNDFSAWVKDVFDQTTLAKELQRAKTPIGMALAIKRWLA